ncbi:pentatricopeptide repeat-containing protein At3g22150, chloroplastic-like [Neltuma alba]|uniref:pentatricopeptide repeat-containing protein At3g22150, chloroplastic-like n=1 Tax=Neltuma alba TaxID=207710 RepID=UPI0010A408C3|nr:pentatricopeptide repeat-containing protein At3g22150, chloroplastic-like [Prosopis alba]XP_028787619.1 pentatricopeptide repeat-containing protein At3g22150, chloroplastic-like [Prosopis alba]XP_028787620.1 pentatricopeptide repeat-containing protein At3g22150, chloroplastic-like [Prosopis alba]XP_028787621.1 pentatricopeptide repeat-containing protein At3g22150, chloroplastic-like [Prosopis alba]XP_028787622.1 pentatricopeptide repeat-containing protein At3g22150, chloroplastic-like [Proso
MASSASPFLPLPLSSPNSHSLSTDTTDSSSLLSIPNPTLKTPSIRSRLSKLCQEGQPHLARQLFDTLPRPSTVLWNTIIIGFICNNMPLEALLFYSQMKSSPGTRFDSYTYSSTLKACAETRNLRAGKAVHCHFLRCQSNPNPSRIVYNSLLNMYSACLSGVEYCGSKNDYVLKVFNLMRKRNVVAWNTLVSWYVKMEAHAEAVKLFSTMMRMRIMPSSVSFVNVFPAVSSLGDYKIADIIYGLLHKFGSEYVEDVFVLSSTINMYAELGCLSHARLIFEQCKERNTEIWNTMIGGYVQNNCPIEAVGIFIQALESEEAVCDDVTFLSALTAISLLQQIKMAEQLHAFILKSMATLSIIILNAIIVMYSRCNSIDTSFKVFHKMLERDVVSWNTMISSFVQNGLDEEALLLVYEMQNQGFMIDSVTVTSLLSTASNLRNKYIGKQTHAYAIRHGIQFEGMESYLIDMYAKCGLVKTTEWIFKQNCPIDKDHSTWNAMIAGYTQNRRHEKAFLVLGEMLEQRVTPNAVTLASILPACSSMGSVAFAKELHGFSIRHSLDLNVYVGTALVDTYSKSGAISYAENVFTSIPEKNSVTYTTMMLGYGQHGMGKRALSLFHSMLGSGHKPDAVTFVAILSACGYAGMVDEGMEIFDSMDEVHKIKPSVEHYCCVTDMLGREGRVLEAYDFVKGLGEDGNALEIWGSLLGACRNHGYFELGKDIANKLLDMETQKGIAGYHVLLSNMFAEEGEWENVDKLRIRMKEKGLQKETGCSWVEIAGSVNCFVSKDERHPESDEIYSILDRLTMEMKHEGYKACCSPKLWILEYDE